MKTKNSRCYPIALRHRLRRRLAGLRPEYLGQQLVNTHGSAAKFRELSAVMCSNRTAEVEPLPCHTFGDVETCRHCGLSAGCVYGALDRFQFHKQTIALLSIAVNSIACRAACLAAIALLL